MTTAYQATAPAAANAGSNHASALKFITCGSVDDGKSTLIGRLLVDSRAVLQDHLAGVQRGGETDLALLTDGLSAEREQGITIDVAYRYFATESRKFIIGDAPGHEQYTRNMVTAASSADAAVVLVDATKLDWQNPALALLPQTRRHSLLAHLLRVHSLVFAVNKLDAVAEPELAFAHISAALAKFAADAGIAVRATVPVSALKGWNVVDAHARWCGYNGPTLLEVLEQLPNTPADTGLPLAFPVQWVEKFSSSADTSQGRRVFWGRVAAGAVAPGTAVQIFPSGQSATVAQVLDHARRPVGVDAGQSAGIILDREVDVSRGDWILAAPTPSRRLPRTISTRPLPFRPGPPAASCGPPWPGWTTSRWWPAAFTGRCTGTAGSRPRSSAWCTAWTSTPWQRTTPRSLTPTPSATLNCCCRSPCPPPCSARRACSAR